MPAGDSVDGRQRAEILKYSSAAVADVWTDLRSFQFKWVVPYEAALSPRILRNPTTWVMLLFGFAPLLGFYVAANDFELMAWLLTYCALAWAAYFYVVVAKRTCSLPIGIGVALFTLFVGCQMDIWLRAIPPLSWLYEVADRRDGLESALAFIVGVGGNEELWKAVPVLLVAFWLRRVSKPLDGLFYGALSGLGFAVREGFKYIGAAGDSTSAVLHQTLIRTTTTPFLHATWTGIGCYFIGLAVASRSRRPALCIVGVATAAGLHGWYDFASDHVVAVGIAALTYLLLISYIDRSQDMLDQLTAREGTRRAHADPIA